MGYVKTIDYDNYPEQSKNIGRRVVVCYKYDTTKMHEGEIIRDDVGERDAHYFAVHVHDAESCVVAHTGRRMMFRAVFTGMRQVVGK